MKSIKLSVSAILIGAVSLLGHPAQAETRYAGVTAEPVVWTDAKKSTTWIEDLMGQIVTYQTLAEKNVISGNFQPYLSQILKVREAHNVGDSRATYDGVNQLMAMLEARVGQVDARSADAIWDFCYRVTPDRYHARDQHVRAKGEAEVKKVEESLRDMEDRARHSF